MRVIASLLRSVLVVTGVLGLELATGPSQSQLLDWTPAVRLDGWVRGPRLPSTISIADRTEAKAPQAAAIGAIPVSTADGAAVDAHAAQVELPADVHVPDEEGASTITAIAVPRLSLRSVVVPAPIVSVPGGTTWDVPAFTVGHGENTAGAGQPGNAVLLGHVMSPGAGSVFKDVHLMRRGDTVHVFSDTREFAYTVTEVRVVPRTDLSVLVPTESATLTLVTCTGTWLPALQDFSHRLAVRADLAGAAQPR